MRIDDAKLGKLLKTAERERSFTWIEDVEAICELVQELIDRRYIEKHSAIREMGLHTLE